MWLVETQFEFHPTFKGSSSQERNVATLFEMDWTSVNFFLSLWIDNRGVEP